MGQKDLLRNTNPFGLNFVYPASNKIVGPYIFQHGEFSRVLLELLQKNGCFIWSFNFY